MSGCLAENTLVEFVEGQLSASDTESLHHHVDTCDACRQLLAEVAGAFLDDRRPTPPPSANSWSLRVTNPSIANASASNLLSRVRDPTPRSREVRLEPGDRVGNYRVARLLGVGGMGAVFEAVHEQIRSRVAIKVLYPHYSENPQMVARFFNEARAVNIVRHPSIVQSFEVGHLQGGAAQGSAFIVMEYLDGESLAARLKRLGGPLGPDTLRITRQVASALLAAHGWGVIHRDLKPGNVMLVPDPEMAGGERVKILDFGLAKVAAELEEIDQHSQMGYATYDGAILGTPAYMAPEQCQAAEAVDEQADVYSLGVLLYECLSGQLPFPAKGAVDLMAMHIYVRPPMLAEQAPGTAPLLCDLVHAMLAKGPADRPTMEEVASELERFDGLLALPQKNTSVPPALSTGRFNAARVAARAEGLLREREDGLTSDPHGEGARISNGAEPPGPPPAWAHQQPLPPQTLGRRVLTGLVTGLAFVGVFSLGRAIWAPLGPGAERIVADPPAARSTQPPIITRVADPRTRRPGLLAAGPTVPAPATAPGEGGATDPGEAHSTAPGEGRATEPGEGRTAAAGRPSGGRPRASRRLATRLGASSSRAAEPRPATPGEAPKPEWTDEKIKIFK